MEQGEAAANIKDGEILHKVCCLCGDIGFADALIRCPRCGYRLQHAYCSRFYPDKIDMENWGCEFCTHHQQQHQQQQGQEDEKATSSTKKTLRTSGGAHANGPPQTHSHARAGVSVGPKKSSKAVDRWRKLARAAKMGSGRRYKLLADVLCSKYHTKLVVKTRFSDKAVSGAREHWEFAEEERGGKRKK